MLNRCKPIALRKQHHCAQKLHYSPGAAPDQDEGFLFFGMGTSRYREEWRNSAGDSFASVLDQVEVLPINTSPGVDAVQWPWILETGEDQVIGTCFWPHYLQSYPLPLLCQNDKQIPPFISILFPDLFSLERKSPRTYIILSPVTRKISTALVLYYVQYEVYCWK